MRRTTIMADEDLLARLQGIAHDEGKPLAEVIREALRRRASEPQPRPTSIGAMRSPDHLPPVDWNSDIPFEPPPWR